MIRGTNKRRGKKLTVVVERKENGERERGREGVKRRAKRREARIDGTQRRNLVAAAKNVGSDGDTRLIRLSRERGERQG